VIPLPPPPSMPVASGADIEDDNPDIKDKVKEESGVVGSGMDEPETATMKAMRVSRLSGVPRFLY
jgi:hypothetical protein